ncbi:integrase [Maribacter algarum]|uniref:Integrase n=1 Tax=Maribacter algarum (ex Zhang et al. 2020) TaxID=2578118 RepID=A0A5S3PIL3_9FLAO|nr:tyrosine-type recombinase/integrase [Maribacter algarum]TMM53189.1 integrase [Maribacter algarum]
MSTVTLIPITHTGIVQVKIDFIYQVDLKAYIKKFPQVRWSQTHGAFCMPFSKKLTNELYVYLRKGNYYVDYSALQKLKSENPVQKPKPAFEKLNQTQRPLLQEYQNYLFGLRLSKSTIDTYSSFIVQLLLYAKDTPLPEIDNTSIRHFVENIISNKKYGISTHRQMIGALKHFGHLFKETKINDLQLNRPKKSRYLPIVLSQREVISLLQCTSNLKHRTILAILYSSGLRVGEIINLNLSDIDIQRKQIAIRQAKGRKDRYVPLAESILPLLINYLNTYKPKVFFIEGNSDNRYSASSIRAFLKKACLTAGIKKPITPHTLRHSYATHLIEDGVGIRHIQELLGHTKPETTMIYTHIAKKDLLSIKSPLDSAVQAIQKSAKAHQKVSLSGTITP